MGQVHHGSATTTAAIRRAIQHSQESLRTLAKRYGINQKTVAKWKKRGSVTDLPTGPKEPRSTVLTVEEEAVIVAFRRYTLLPLDDCLYALQPTIPHLTRSSLHRCLQRHGISRLPDVEGDRPAKRKFKSYPIGYFHIDIAEVRTEQGKLHMFVAIDRTSKFAFVELHGKATTAVSREFLLRLIAAVPYKIHTVLTDNGIQFTTPVAGGPAVPLIKAAIANGEIFRAHAFEYACARNDIEHRTTKVRHPWTNGQVERMNRTIKDATVKRFYYESHDQLRQHLADFVAAYNFARRLKTLKGPTPYEFICKAWTSQPQRFTVNPLDQAQAQRKAKVEPHRMGDDLGWKTVALVADGQGAHACASIATGPNKPLPSHPPPRAASINPGGRLDITKLGGLAHSRLTRPTAARWRGSEGSLGPSESAPCRLRAARASTVFLPPAKKFHRASKHFLRCWRSLQTHRPGP